MDFGKAVDTMLGKNKDKKFEYDKEDTFRNVLNFKKKDVKNKKEKEVIDIEVTHKCPTCSTELKKQLSTKKLYCKKCLKIVNPNKKVKQGKEDDIFEKAKKGFKL
jgi:protein-arginine kinase activator protein McsA